MGTSKDPRDDINTTDDTVPGTGAGNYSLREEMPPQYEMPKRMDGDAQAHVKTQFVPYRGQEFHGVSHDVVDYRPPDQKLVHERNLPPGKPNKRVVMPDPIPVRIISYPDRQEIIRSRMYSINLVPQSGAATYGPSSLIFGRDMGRVRAWLVGNAPTGFAIYINDSPDNSNAFPLPNPAAAGQQAPIFGPIYTNDPIWAFTNNPAVCQVMVYVEYSSLLETGK